MKEIFGTIYKNHLQLNFEMNPKRHKSLKRPVKLMWAAGEWTL